MRVSFRGPYRAPSAADSGRAIQATPSALSNPCIEPKTPEVGPVRSYTHDPSAQPVEGKRHVTPYGTVLQGLSDDGGRTAR